MLRLHEKHRAFLLARLEHPFYNLNPIVCELDRS